MLNANKTNTNGTNIYDENVNKTGKHNSINIGKIHGVSLQYRCIYQQLRQNSA